MSHTGWLDGWVGARSVTVLAVVVGRGEGCAKTTGSGPSPVRRRRRRPPPPLDATQTKPPRPQSPPPSPATTSGETRALAPLLLLPRTPLTRPESKRKDPLPSSSAFPIKIVMSDTVAPPPAGEAPAVPAQRPRLVLKPRDPEAAKALEQQRQAASVSLGSSSAACSLPLPPVCLTRRRFPEERGRGVGLARARTHVRACPPLVARPSRHPLSSAGPQGRGASSPACRRR